MLGKGGVGKSTVAGAMGLAAARAGQRALLVEVAGEHNLSRLFRAAKVGADTEVELAPGLYGISIDAEAATEEYLAGQLKVRPLVELLTRSKAFHTFAAAAPGLPELVTIGKIWSLAIALNESGHPLWDVVIVDCPATGHGIALLATAGNVEELAAGGPIRDQAARIHEVVSHPAATGIVVVALPEELAVSEAIEAAATLRERGLPVAATVLNAVRPPRFTPADEPALEAAAGNGRRSGARGRARRAGAPGPRALGRAATASGWRRRPGCRCSTSREVVTRRFDLAALGTLADAIAAGAGAGR